MAPEINGYSLRKSEPNAMANYKHVMYIQHGSLIHKGSSPGKKFFSEIKIFQPESLQNVYHFGKLFIKGFFMGSQVVQC